MLSLPIGLVVGVLYSMASIYVFVPDNGRFLHNTLVWCHVQLCPFCVCFGPGYHDRHYIKKGLKVLAIPILDDNEGFEQKTLNNTWVPDMPTKLAVAIEKDRKSLDTVIEPLSYEWW